MAKNSKQISMTKKGSVPAGPSGKMMQGQATGTQKPGVTSQEQSRSKDKTPVKGGTTKMFGKQGVKPAKPA